jgi:hypothetical protein
MAKPHKLGLSLKLETRKIFKLSTIKKLNSQPIIFQGWNHKKKSILKTCQRKKDSNKKNWIKFEKRKKNMEDEVVKKNQKLITNKIYCNQKNEN